MWKVYNKPKTFRKTEYWNRMKEKSDLLYWWVLHVNCDEPISNLAIGHEVVTSVHKQQSGERWKRTASERAFFKQLNWEDMTRARSCHEWLTSTWSPLLSAIRRRPFGPGHATCRAASRPSTGQKRRATHLDQPLSHHLGGGVAKASSLNVALTLNMLLERLFFTCVHWRCHVDSNVSPSGRFNG